MAGNIIPDFVSTASTQAAPLPTASPAAAALPGNALADGMARVDAQFGEVWRAAHQQQAVTTATALDGQHAMDLSDLANSFRNDPNPATVPDRFKAAAQALTDKALVGVDDPSVASYVQRNAAQRTPVYYAEVARQAAAGVMRQGVDIATTGLQAHTQLLADAPNPAAETLAVQGMKQAMTGPVALNAMTPAQATAALSGGYTTAILQRATTNPAAAAALFARLKPEMDPDHILRVEQTLKGADIDAQGAAMAAHYLATPAAPGAPPASGAPAPASPNAAPGGSSDAAPPAAQPAPAAPTSPPADWVGRMWPQVIQAESGGRQTNPDGSAYVSPVGGDDAPVGASQIRPSTAADVAARNGWAFDPQRLRTDAVYNQQLGRAYWNQLATTYGNPVLTAAAYNAGPGRVDGWIKSIGDPRTGQISDQDFANAVPLAETRAYIAKVGALTGNPDIPHVNYGMAMQRAMVDLSGNPPLLQATLKHMQVAATVQQAADLDAQRQEAINQKARHDAAEAAANTIVSQLITDPTKVDPAQIANDPYMTHETKWSLFRMAQAAQPAPPGQDRDTATYGPGFWNAYQAVHAADGDPNKITDPSVLYPRGGPGGDLTVAGIDKLSAEIALRRTPEGEAEAEMRKAMFSTARAELTHDDFGLKDPQGNLLFQRFLASALPAYDAGRKAGKTPVQLLNPDSPDYVGKVLQTLRRSPAQVAADLDAANNASPAAPQAAPDLTTQDGIVGAYRAGRIPRATAAQLLLDHGFAAAPAAPRPAGDAPALVVPVTP